LLVVPLLLVVALLGALWWAKSTYDRIERVDLSDVLDPVSGDATNYLLVGSDSREELDPEGESGVTGTRSDTIIVLRTTPEGAAMMSIPRDLWVEVADTGEMGRINGAYNRGPANLVRTVQQNLDIPVNHYMEIGFGSFVGLVDAIGGVTIDFPHPAFDTESGLVVEQSGPVVLDGTQALAYARARNYTEVIDGEQVLEPTADLGRQQRQQLFLRTALAEVGATRNPVTLVRVADAMSDELVVDSGLGFWEATSLVRKMGGGSPLTVVLPTEGTRRGDALVLVLDEPEAQEVLDAFR
jgi:LCP family protein required for cell wall assembly